MELETKNTELVVKEKMFNPFPGLRPFSTDESHLFFGREGQSQEVLDFLAKNKFVALLGTSGSGKSSLMYCGVIPILQGGFITEAGVDWKVITTRPGQNPVKNLATAINDEFDVEGDNSILQQEYIHSSLTASSLGLVEMLNQVPRKKKQNILLLVDQFEELFRFKRIKNNEESFNEVLAYIKLLIEVWKQKDTPVYIVITMRSDFIGECAQFQDLTKLINDSHYLIPQMNRHDFREAIEGPIAVGGGKVSPFLVQQLLNDIGDRPDQLPILQHALMRTWNSWIQSGRTDEPIDIKDYENIGKLEKALSEHANEAYNELTQDQKDLCQNIFKTLTEKGGDNRGVRRPTQVSEIAQISSSTPEKIIEVVEHFRITGRSFLSPASSVKLDKDSVIDISHESLMRIWDKLIIWVSEEYEAVLMYKRLSESSENYQLGETGLWRPPDLQLAISWRDKQNPTLTWAKRHNPAFERTMVYLETSHKEFKLEEENKIKQQKRAIRRTRVFALVLGTASIISIFFMINSFLAKQESDEQTEIAQEQTELAKKEKENALEQTRFAEEQKSIAEEQQRLALEQKELAEVERKNALKSAQEARRQQKIADQKSEEASQQRLIAEESLEEAKRQQELAELATTQAQKLRMLSISQSMAVKSVQINIDTTLKALLAYQSYSFNKTFEGDMFNADVYNGLYYAQKSILGSEVTDFLAHKYPVRTLALNESNGTFYSTGNDGIIQKWNVSNSSDTTVFYETNQTNRVLRLSNDNKTLFVGLNNGGILSFNLSQTPVVANEIVSLNSAINVIEFISKEELLCISKDGHAIIYNTLSEKSDEIEGEFNAKKLLIIENNTYAVSTNGLLIKVNSLQPLDIVYYTLTFTEDGKTAQLLEVDAASNIDKQHNINAASYNQSKNTLAIGDIEGNIVVFNNDTFDQRYRLTGHTARINALAFDSEGSFLASACNDGLALMWDTEDFNSAPYQFDDNSSWVMDIKFSESGDYILTAYANGMVRKWMTNTSYLAENIKPKITRNFTEEEWNQYVGKDIEYKKTIENIP